MDVRDLWADLVTRRSPGGKPQRRDVTTGARRKEGGGSGLIPRKQEGNRREERRGAGHLTPRTSRSGSSSHLCVGVFKPVGAAGSHQTCDGSKQLRQL